MFDPTFVKHPSPYDLNHIPTPPPPPQQEPLWFRLACVLIYTLIVILVGAVALVAVHNAIPATSAPTLNATPTPSTTLTPTVLLNRTPASQSGIFMPAFLSSYSPPQAGLPYTSITVYDAFRATRIQMNTVEYSDGWDGTVAYQPEGKLVTWEESYGVVVEIATFATPTEAETDAHDLLTTSSGFSVYTRNLCLLFYDDSISNTALAHYLTSMSAVCT